jgi:hypothetical protein
MQRGATWDALDVVDDSLLALDFHYSPGGCGRDWPRQHVQCP